MTLRPVPDLTDDQDEPGRRPLESRGPFWRVYELREPASPCGAFSPSSSRPASAATCASRRSTRPPASAPGSRRARRRRCAASTAPTSAARPPTSPARTATPAPYSRSSRPSGGEQGKLHPSHVKTKRTAVEDGRKLERLQPVIGDVPIRAFRVEDAERALASLPADLAPATVRTYVMFLHRVLALAVYPGKLLAANP